MTNAELIATIRNEIERRIEAIAKAPSDNGVMDSINGARGHELMKLLSFLSTLEQSEKPMNPEDAMKELDEKIALVKRRGTWDGVDVDKYMDEVRGRKPEKPMGQEGLEEEMDKFFETMPVLEHENIFEDTFKKIARHFAKWGAEHSGSSEIPNDLKEAVKNYIYKAADSPGDACPLRMSCQRYQKWLSRDDDEEPEMNPDYHEGECYAFVAKNFYGQ